MDLCEMYAHLDSQCPSDYKINEIIPFAYPFRRIRLNVTVNKSPERSIQQVYSVLLRAIQAGFVREDDLVQFLGLNKGDFILSELYFLRERGFVELISGEWFVTEQGRSYISDSSILKILEEEEFEFMFDPVTNEIQPKVFTLRPRSEAENLIAPEFDFDKKSPEILNGKHEQLSDIYKREKNGQAYLVDYDKNKIHYDKQEFGHFYLVEYIPRKGKEKEIEPYVEVRADNKDLILDKRLTKYFSRYYPDILYLYSNSERSKVAGMEAEYPGSAQKFENQQTPRTKNAAIEELSIWETQQRFEQALETAETKILIESPWIKKATLKYIPSIQAALKRGVVVVILYGIEFNDDHDYSAIRELHQLANEHSNNLHLIHLPAHITKHGVKGLSGTHRKLVIKDHDYYILGSFNFLSFNKNEGQKVANEQSMLVSDNVARKWSSVLKEYGLDNSIFPKK